MTSRRRLSTGLAAIALLVACGLQPARSQDHPASDGLSHLYAAAASRAAAEPGMPAPPENADAGTAATRLVTAVTPVVSVIRARTLADGSHVLVCGTEPRADFAVPLRVTAPREVRR